MAKMAPAQWALDTDWSGSERSSELARVPSPLFLVNQHVDPTFLNETFCLIIHETIPCQEIGRISATRLPGDSSACVLYVGLEKDA